jgi:hypothetical protein
MEAIPHLRLDPVATTSGADGHRGLERDKNREWTDRREDTMHAVKGDHLLVHGNHVGEPNREGEIIEAQGPDGAPPYLVRWSDSGHESLVYPGGDAVIQHASE